MPPTHLLLAQRQRIPPPPGRQRGRRRALQADLLSLLSSPFSLCHSPATRLPWQPHHLSHTTWLHALLTFSPTSCLHLLPPSTAPPMHCLHAMAHHTCTHLHFHTVLHTFALPSTHTHAAAVSSSCEKAPYPMECQTHDMMVSWCARHSY